MACKRKCVSVHPALGSQSSRGSAVMRTTGKMVKRGLPGARGLESWDPVVAVLPFRGQAFRVCDRQ